MENILISQANHLIKKSIIGPPGIPDWTTILQIIEIISNQSEMTQIFIDVLIKHLEKDPIGLKLNCLILIDSLFKNCKKDSLKFLQTYRLPEFLLTSTITDIPNLHNFIYKSALSWVNSCKNNKCLKNSFEEWQKKICSSHFIPNLTSNIKNKFLLEIDASIEILLMFSQCLITSFAENKGFDDILLLEILPNIQEIRSRTAELLPTLLDKDLKIQIQRIGDFSGLVLGFYEEYRKKNSFDNNKLLISIKKLQKIKNKENTNNNIKNNNNNDISDEEFFLQLKKLKEKENQIVDNLLII